MYIKAMRLRISITQHGVPYNECNHQGFNLDYIYTPDDCTRCMKHRVG